MTHLDAQSWQRFCKALPFPCKGAHEPGVGAGIRFHEGRTCGHRTVNVDSWRLHEGRGAGKSTTPGGREKHAYFLKLAGDGPQVGAPPRESPRTHRWLGRSDSDLLSTFHSRLIYSLLPCHSRKARMMYRVLGKTGLKVSEVGFGAWAIGGNAHGNSYGPTDDK